MTVDERRSVLNKLIERITVCRGYQIQIKFNVNLEDFIGDKRLQEGSELVRVS